jgi:hypothetical protein
VVGRGGIGCGGCEDPEDKMVSLCKLIIFRMKSLSVCCFFFSCVSCEDGGLIWPQLHAFYPI